MTTAPTAFRPIVTDVQRNREFRRVADSWYRLTILREGLVYDVKRLRWERGELLGLLVVFWDGAGAKAVDGTLSVGTFSLTSVSARTGRAKELAASARAEELDFRYDLEELCQRVITAEQTGTPITLLRNVTLQTTDAAVFAFHGMQLPLKHPSVIHAAGGTGKTTIARAIMVELERCGVPTLYLDWEQDEFDHREGFEALLGDEFDAFDLKYRRCERPLSIEAEGIATQIEQCGIRFVICDSAGFASDGRPEDAEVALRYFRALRQLGVGSLTLAHISSGEQSAEKPFGSVFWFNSARSIWFLEKSGDSPLPDAFTVGAFNKKSNLTRLQPGTGFLLDFAGGRVSVTPTRLEDNADLAAKLPLSQRMRSALRRGPKTLAILADELDASVDTLDRYVRRSKQYYVKVEGSDGITRIALAERHSR